MVVELMSVDGCCQRMLIESDKKIHARLNSRTHTLFQVKAD
jgi:hypothetical protein